MLRKVSCRAVITVAFAVGFAASGAQAATLYSENFDLYTSGSNLAGSGGWAVSGAATGATGDLAKIQTDSGSDRSLKLYSTALPVPFIVATQVSGITAPGTSGAITFASSLFTVGRVAQ